MKQKLITSFQEELAKIAPQSSVKFIKEISAEELALLSIKSIYLYTRKGKGSKIAFAETAVAVGNDIRAFCSLKKDSGNAAKIGAFIIYVYQCAGFLSIELSNGKKHATYYVNVEDDEALNEIWETVPTEKTEKLPSPEPYVAWENAYHPTGAVLVKTHSKEVLNSISAKTHPIIFNAINRAQKVGWQINKEMMGIFEWALKHKAEAFADIWEMQSPEAKQSKIREARAILSIAKRFKDSIFYHIYYADFRFRIYPGTAYLHEQGVDVAKSLLLRADKKKIGEQGFFWLLICIASNWAGDANRADKLKTDKIPLKDRVEWALDNEEILLSYAESPKVNQGWMQADAPWCFLAGCIELRKAREWEEMNAHKGLTLYDYESHLEGYIDGSCNGMQHLATLTKDEITAQHVNLYKTELPGDLYRYVAGHVWSTLDREVAKISPKEYARLESVIATIKDIRNQVAASELKSERRLKLTEEYFAFKESVKGDLHAAAPVFWHKITDAKEQRKICKRNTMTISYGSTPYGMGSQQKDDARKHGIPHLNQMETAWATYLGRLVYEDCKVSLARPMRVLGILEEAGSAAEKAGEFLKWTLPITNAPVVQHYEEGTVKKVNVAYGDDTLQISVSFKELPKYAKGRQRVAAAPNMVHSLDAAHLMLTKYNCNFEITTIHDAYGALLGDMSELYIITRESFVQLYTSCNVLEYLGKQVNANLDGFEYGTYDVRQFLESEYGFC